MNINTWLRMTDEGTIGVYTSLDGFENADNSRALADMVEEYCKLFELHDTPFVISSDCYDLVGGLRDEILKALKVVDLYVDSTARNILNPTGEYHE